MLRDHRRALTDLNEREGAMLSYHLYEMRNGITPSLLLLLLSPIDSILPVQMQGEKKKGLLLFEYACHPCTGTMLIFSVYLSVCLMSQPEGWTNT